MSVCVRVLIPSQGLPLLSIKRYTVAVPVSKLRPSSLARARIRLLKQKIILDCYQYRTVAIRSETQEMDKCGHGRRCVINLSERRIKVPSC